MSLSCESLVTCTARWKSKILSDGPSACDNCVRLLQQSGDKYMDSAESLDALNKTCEHLSGVHAKAVADFEEAKVLLAGAAAQEHAGNTSSLYAHRSEKEYVVEMAKEAWHHALEERDSFLPKREDMLVVFQVVAVRKLECEIRARAMHKKLLRA